MNLLTKAFRNGVFLLLIWGMKENCYAQEINVMSYNIRYANPDDGPNYWENRKEDLFESLKEIQPDFIGMQEVLHKQLVALTSQMRDYSYVGVGREDGKTIGEYSPILYRKDKFTVVDSGTFWLSETPNQISVGWDAALERICTYARFRQPQSNLEFWVFNTHFDHVGTLARAKAAQLILDQIKTLNKSKLPVVLTGDFNLTPDQTPIKILQSELEDVQQNLSDNAPNYGTFNGFDVENSGKRRIDYVFQKGFTLQKATHLLLKTKKGYWLSDHHPVTAILSFKNEN
jgi:endonuclease/exonuclease/phosphatase family metal-dependent hydrolase